jgi:hypothetical protein
MIAQDDEPTKPIWLPKTEHPSAETDFVVSVSAHALYTQQGFARFPFLYERQWPTYPRLHDCGASLAGGRAGVDKSVVQEAIPAPPI